MGDEKEFITETAIDIEPTPQPHNGKEIVTKSDRPVEPHNGKEIVTKSDRPVEPHEPHNGGIIDQIIVSEDNSYAVTYSEEDLSIRGWLINVEENGQQQPDVYFKLERSYEFNHFELFNKILLAYNSDDDDDNNNNNGDLKLIDLSSKEGRYLQLKRTENIAIISMGFLPNLSKGDLVLVSLDKKLKNYKIYLYPLENKPTCTTLWEYSQVYDIEFHKSLTDLNYIDCFIRQKLFILNEGHLTQWDLKETSFESKMQCTIVSGKVFKMVVNKDQTLLASCNRTNVFDKIDIYSMETGKSILRYPGPKDKISYIPVRFVTFKNGFEGLIIRSYKNKKCTYRFLDPFHPSDDPINITNDIADDIADGDNIILTTSNKKFYINKNNVWITDGLNEDRFPKQRQNKTTLYNDDNTFKTIQNMLKDIVNNGARDFSGIIDERPFYLENGIERGYGNEVKVYIKQAEKGICEKGICYSSGELKSYKKLHNQDLALITTTGIYIYAIIDDSLRLRYLWNNEKLHKRRQFNNDGDYRDFNNNDGDYRADIQNILNNEFNDSSVPYLPKPEFNLCNCYREYHDFVFSIINDPSEFASAVIQDVIEAVFERGERKVGDARLILDKVIIELIKNDDFSSLPIICSMLLRLCDPRYSSLVMKYFAYTSILLDPSCVSDKGLAYNSLYAYSKDICIKKSNLPLPITNWFKSLFSSFYKIIGSRLRTQERISIPTISFIVPFPKICEYRENDLKNTEYRENDSKNTPKNDLNTWNDWNDILCEPKSVLFCNVDNNNFYKWWNFAAIVDFKWKTYGRIYHFLIWFFYTIFSVCFMVATILDLTDLYRKILFIITILFGFIHLSFEFREFLWKPWVYLRDPWSLFDIGAYSLPTITSICWLINGSLLPSLVASSILLLNFKFLLFFRVFQSYGKYFVIITGVAKEVFPFLVVLFFIILGFGLAFFILLRPADGSSLDQPAFNNDINNPWNLTTQYNSIDLNGKINPVPTLIQAPDSKTNMFSGFSTSLLAMYLFLTGDSGSLSSWSYTDEPAMTILLFLFTFFTAIYLMNLFIGLLNMAIDKYNRHEEYLLSLAWIIAQIEVLYMLPHQRQNKEWFPDWIYYYMHVDEVQKLIHAIDDNKTEFNSQPFISKKLRDLIGIPEPIDDHGLQQAKYELQQRMTNQNEQTINKLKQMNDEFKQANDELKQQMKDIQELLVKNSNTLNTSNTSKQT